MKDSNCQKEKLKDSSSTNCFSLQIWLSNDCMINWSRGGRTTKDDRPIDNGTPRLDEEKNIYKPLIEQLIHSMQSAKDPL